MRAPGVLLITLLVAAPSWGQVYKWVDENGRVHYGEKPPANKGAPVNLRDATGGPRPEPKEEEVKDAPPVGARSAPRRETALQRQEREFQERQERRDRDLADERKRQEEASRPSSNSDRIYACRTARNDVAIMDRFSTSYTFAQRSEALDRVSRYCR